MERIMPKRTVEINGANYEINSDYEYEDQDITAILNARIRQYNGLVGNTPVYQMASIDTITQNQLIQRLNDDKDNNPQGRRIVLIPCNIGNYHWVGLLLEFDENNACIRAEFMNSTHSEIPPTLQNQLQYFYHRDFETYHNVIKQNDGTSCGACAIENLILRMLKLNPPENVNMFQLRAQHLNILRTDSEELNIAENERNVRRRFFESFNQRQRLNQRTFNSTQFMPANVDNKTYKSGSEMQAIVEIAEMLLQINEERFNKKIQAIFNSILERKKEHKAIFDDIRSTLWEFSDDLNIQKISNVIFGIKDISNFGKIQDYHAKAVLQFDYSYLESIAEFVVNDDQLIKFKNKQNHRKEILVNLRDSNDLIRQKSAESLRDLPESLKEDELNLLRDVATYDTYQTVRIAAAEALYIKGIKEDKDKSQKIVFDLLTYPGFGKPHQDGADLVRERAAKALVILKDCRPEVIKTLTYAMEDPFLNVREAAQNALEQLKQYSGTLHNVPSVSIQSFDPSSAEQKLDYLKKATTEQANALKNEFDKKPPDYNLIKKSFYLFSWRVNEISWGYKYKLKDKGLVSEEAWHLFDFICRYLTMNPDFDLSNWGELADECQKLSEIISTEKGTELKFPSLLNKIRPVYAQSQLKMIHQQMNNFFNSSISFNSESSIDFYALLGLLMVIGEGAKRLEGIDPKLRESVMKELNGIKDIRDLLEKKLPGNLFNSPKLIGEVYTELKLLKESIDKYFQESPEIIDISETKALHQLLNLLEEEASYKYQEQAKIFFASIEDNQKELLKFLQEKNYASVLKNRFNIEFTLFEEAVNEEAKNQVQILSKDQKDNLINLVTNHLKDHPKLNALLKLIRSPKTKPNGIEQFLSSNKLNIPEIANILSAKSETSSAALSSISASSGLTKENILEVKKLFDTLDKHRSESDFDTILFTKIKALPWLLNLNELQSKFLRILNQEETIGNQEALDELLKANRLDGDKINKILYTANLLYSPRPYYKKFAYPKVASNEILRIVRMIDALIKLLLQMKSNSSAAVESSFSEVIIANHTYQFAIQIAIKAFGVIVKDKLGEEAKQQLLANNTDELSAKHIRLLELFRNELAHLAAEVDPHQLVWFALQWAIISYPDIKQISIQSNKVISVPIKNQPEITITELMLTEHAILIRDLAKSHGCTKVRAFGYSLGCPLGIQAELNLIIEPLPETTATELYNLQWKIHFVLGYNVRVFTEKSLKDYLSLTSSVLHVDEIIAQAIDLLSLQHLSRIKEMIDSEKWHNVLLIDQSKPIRRVDIKPDSIDLKKVSTIVLASQSDDFVREKQYRETLLKLKEVKENILKKANFYVDRLLKLIQTIDQSIKPIFLKLLKTTMTLNSELDQFYEAHTDEILSHDLQISRFNFRHKMRAEHNKLPDEIKDSDLAKRAKQDWDNEACIIKRICKKNGKDAANLLNMLYFLLDEVHNPGIIELLFDNNIHNNQDLGSQLLNCIYLDFCKRFVDPYEEDATVHFTNGIHKHNYMRIPFYAEVLKDLSQSILPIPIIDWGIELGIKHKILNIHHKYKSLPEEKEMTIDKLFEIKQNWQYGGKVQKLSCRAATFECPPITDFDTLLKKEKISPERYPEYEKDKIRFNQFQEAKGCLYNVYYYEKHIKNFEQYKAKLEHASLTLIQGSQAYKINREYFQEIVAKIALLKDLQQQHIKNLIACQYIIIHPRFNCFDFKKRLTQELVDWVYYDKNDSSSKGTLSEFVLNCLNINSINTLSPFFSSVDDLINNNQLNSPGLRREHDKAAVLS
jgi:hypothetical protein